MLLQVLEIIVQIVDAAKGVRGVGSIEYFGRLGLHVPDVLQRFLDCVISCRACHWCFKEWTNVDEGVDIAGRSANLNNLCFLIYSTLATWRKAHACGWKPSVKIYQCHACNYGWDFQFLWVCLKPKLEFLCIPHTSQVNLWFSQLALFENFHVKVRKGQGTSRKWLKLKISFMKWS